MLNLLVNVYDCRRDDHESRDLFQKLSLIISVNVVGQKYDIIRSVEITTFLKHFETFILVLHIVI